MAIRSFLLPELLRELVPLFLPDRFRLEFFLLPGRESELEINGVVDA